MDELQSGTIQMTALLLTVNPTALHLTTEITF